MATRESKPNKGMHLTGASPTGYQVLFAVFALSIPVITLIVGGRLTLCTWQLVRTSHYKVAAVSLLGVLALLSLFVFFIIVWFGYGVAHTRKDLGTDLRVVVLTGVPFYGLSFCLWRLGAYLQSVPSAHSSKQ